MRKNNFTLFFGEGNPAFEDADAAVLGVGFGETESYGKGSAKGPAAIFRASHQVELEQPLTGKTLEAGIHNMGIIKPKASGQMVKETAALAKKALGAGKFFILLGGEHSIVNGLLLALPKETSFVNFDAHLDLRNEWDGTKMSHACVARRIFEKGFDQQWIGVRDQVSEEEIKFLSEKNISEKIFYCGTQPKSFYKKNAYPIWAKKENFISEGKLGEEQMQKMLQGIGSGKVWLNIDVDCVDPAQMPGTGTPVPFGLKAESLNEIIYRVVESKNVIGFNLVELLPGENDLASEMLAAMICYNIVAWKFGMGAGEQ